MVSLNSCTCLTADSCTCGDDCTCEGCGCENCVGGATQCACGGNCAHGSNIVIESSD